MQRLGKHSPWYVESKEIPFSMNITARSVLTLASGLKYMYLSYDTYLNKVWCRYQPHFLTLNCIYFSSWHVLHVDPEIHEFPGFVAQFASLLYQRMRYVPVTQLTSLEGEVFINWRSFSRRVTLPAVGSIRWHCNLDVIFKFKGCILCRRIKRWQGLSRMVVINFEVEVPIEWQRNSVLAKPRILDQRQSAEIMVC